MQSCTKYSIKLFLLESLLSSLGLFALSNLGGSGFDDTNSDGLPHVTNSEPSKWWKLGESFNTHGLAWHQSNNSSITRFDKLGEVFSRLTSTTINLLLDLSKL